MKRIGILGGGQLGCMLADSLYRLGAAVAVYDPDPNAPLCRRTDRAVNAPWDDVAALSRFAADCDRVTYEFENVESDPLQAVAARTQVWPSVEVLHVSQHRLREKQFLQQHRLPHAAFRPVTGPAALGTVPVIVKTVEGGYDGKGQFRYAPGAVVPALPGPCVAEEPIHIDAEVSCIVACPPHGDPVCFPVFENEHTQHILDTTIVPATLPAPVRKTVEAVATEVARRLSVVGLLTVEFFLTRQKPERSATVEVEGWHVLVNELAPRPHNSGHVTRRACTLSQFDALAHILLDIPLSQPQLVDRHTWAMGNLLGDVYGHAPQLDLSPWRDFPTVREVCLYGKAAPRPGRKMGHFIVREATAAAARHTIQRFRSELKARLEH